MFNLFGKPYSSEVLKTSKTSVKGYVPIFGNEPRPSIEHVCSPDGFWVLPEKTNSDIAKARAARYAAETDPLLVELAKDERMGEDVSEKIAVYQAKVRAIKEDLPWVQSKLIHSHYLPVVRSSDGEEE